MSEMKVSVRGRLLGGGVWKVKDDNGKYSACVVLDEGEEAKIMKIRDAALKEEFGDKVPKSVKDWTAREGDDEEYELSYEKWFINPKSTRPIAKKVKRAGKVLDVTEEDDLIYPGADVAISVSAYAKAGYKDDDGNKVPGYVTLNARAIMFLGHNERLTDDVADEEFDDFESVEAEMDDEDWGDEED